MTTLTQLIEQYCSDGVEYVKLGDVATVKAGSSVSKQKIAESAGIYPVINSGREPLGFIAEFNSTDPIGITTRGAGVGFVSWTEGPHFKGNLNYNVKVNSDIVSDRFLFFTLKEHGQSIRDLCSFAGIPALNLKSIKTLAFPLPPREVQDAIVERLDALAALIESLDSEIALREKRFEYFREQLLTFDESDGVEYVKLGEVAGYSPLRVDSADLNADTFVGVDNLLKDRGGKALSEHGPNTKRSTKYQVGDVLIGNIRPYLRKIWHATNEGGCSGDVLAIHPSKVDARFLYWTLFGDEFWHYNNNFSRGGKMPRGDKAAILAYQFPLPSLEVQQDIADKLDTMQALIDNLKKERELRKTQFEYHREKLLTFNS
ncbi:restriction endonuclease subunit S [Corynebacterium tuberculostearicum]|uniref:Type I restriction modification DNA specificity domain protein n=1 Tax=Corynebacterium tuberculostearicum SK141 TaxID=553206 RepID=C6R861_9CORY|nr:restriction endonuclease subunit S [Corynebacterium tuberculostearicum]EET77860.1 type I restriction modification DNA specificity domain protein [Corynebacterium tuberculostearicum SK141]